MMTITALAPATTTTAAMMSVTSGLVFRCGGAKGQIARSTYAREAGDAMANHEADADQAETEPRPAAVTFVTTEHFTLQGARSSAIAEATGRATMFLAAVSGGLVALGLVATAAGVSTAFYAFALILLPTLALVGLTTFNRVLQSGIEDFGYARRIARLRGYYFQYAPELVGYLLSVPPAERLRMQGIGRALADVPDGLRDGRARHRRAGRLRGRAAGSRRL
jgi:hypothetical protein